MYLPAHIIHSSAQAQRIIKCGIYKKKTQNKYVDVFHKPVLLCKKEAINFVGT